jgi:nitrite reductase/ring-hydroxylating ferredoxin subunit
MFCCLELRFGSGIRRSGRRNSGPAGATNVANWEVDRIPTVGTGKIKRNVLRERRSETPMSLTEGGMGQRFFACRVGELAPGTSMTLAGPLPKIALHRSEGGEFFATADACTHGEWPLGDEGEIEGAELVCTLHMARFDLATGKPLCLPATDVLATYSVVVEDDQVFVLG